MKKISINILGFILACAVALFWVKVATDSNGIAKEIADFIFSHGVIYIISVIGLLVYIDALKRKIAYAFLWALGVLVLPMISLPLYLIKRSQIP